MSASYIEYCGVHSESETNKTSTLPRLPSANAALNSTYLGSQFQRRPATAQKYKAFKYYKKFGGLVDERSPEEAFNWTLANTGNLCQPGIVTLERFASVTEGTDLNFVRQDITGSGEQDSARDALACVYLSLDNQNSSWTTVQELSSDFVRVHVARSTLHARLGHIVSKGPSLADGERFTRDLVSVGPSPTAVADPKQRQREETLSLLASWLVEARDPALDNEDLTTLMLTLDEDRKGGRKLFESR